MRYYISFSFPVKPTEVFAVENMQWHKI